MTDPKEPLAQRLHDAETELVASFRHDPVTRVLLAVIAVLLLILVVR